MASTNMKTVVKDETRLTMASVHLALTFKHRQQGYSVLWDGVLTWDFLRGTSLKKHPVWGLYDLMNLTVKYLRDHLYRDVLPRSHRDDIDVCPGVLNKYERSYPLRTYTSLDIV